MSQTRDRRSQGLTLLGVLLCWALAASGWAAPSPVAPGHFQELAAESAQRDALEAIARHPAPLRDAALRLSTEPQVIVQVEGIRAWSSRGFEAILEGKDEAERADLWEVIRYPELVDAVIREAELPDPSEEIPAEAHETARRSAAHSFEALEKIHALQQDTDSAFAEVLDELEPSLAEALESVATEPALLSVLAENLELTVELGEAYQREPGEVRAWLADLSERVIASDESERDQWSETLRDDDQLRDEVVEAASAWEQEQESLPRQAVYDDGYDHGYERGWTDGRSVATHVRPYPYWFGYPVRASDVFVPAAHAYSLWTPRSHWGHLGFSVGHGNSIVIVSAPSFPFLYWLRARHPDHRYVRSYAHQRRARHLWHATGHRVHHAHQFRTKRHHKGHRRLDRDGVRDRRDPHRRVARLKLDGSRDDRRARRSDRVRRNDQRARSRNANDRRGARAKPRKSRDRASGKSSDRRARSEKKARAGRASSKGSRQDVRRSGRTTRKKANKNSARRASLENPRQEPRQGRVTKPKQRAKRKDARRSEKTSRKQAKPRAAKKRARRADRADARTDTKRGRANTSRRKARGGQQAKARTARAPQRAETRRSAKASRPKAKPNRSARKKARAEQSPKARKAKRNNGKRERRGRRVARR